MLDLASLILEIIFVLASLGKDLSSSANMIFPQLIFEGRIKSYFSIV